MTERTLVETENEMEIAKIRRHLRKLMDQPHFAIRINLILFDTMPENPSVTYLVEEIKHEVDQLSQPEGIAIAADIISHNLRTFLDKLVNDEMVNYYASGQYKREMQELNLATVEELWDYMKSEQLFKQNGGPIH